MVFSDQSFVFFFLPLALAVCLGLWRTRAFHGAVLLFSLVFFYWSSGWLTLVLIASIALNYSGGLLVSRHRSKPLLAAILSANLILLGWFKYAGFAAGIFDFTLSPTLVESARAIILPIGISFYTFQGMSYVLDVWRGHTRPEPNPLIFAAYQAFFPQLIAGPIVRYADVAADFHAPHISVDNFTAGASRFMLGLLKKVVIADTVAVIANATFFSGQPMGFASAWIGTIAFAIQIYFDFSGYSDMAIGLAMMFGIRFEENFNHPYAASTFTEFWRRWHISLSSWFRDYLYIPLGGNRLGASRTYLNLLIVFLATGIWHGAAWTFVLWGLYHGAFIVAERLIFKGRLPHSEWLRLCYFFPVVLIGWTLFQAPDIGTFWRLLNGMITPFAADALAFSPAMTAAISPQSLCILGFGIAAMVLQRWIPPLGPVIESAATPPRVAARAVFILGGMVVSALFILPQSFSPFLYFRF
ncbi:MAG: MBOAT family O-acyltransferase [Methyloligella sp. ZOD6]